MPQLPRNLLQHRPISFRCTKIKVLNIAAVYHIWSWKLTNRRAQLFLTFNVTNDFLSWLFNVYMKLQNLCLMLFREHKMSKNSDNFIASLLNEKYKNLKFSGNFLSKLFVVDLLIKWMHGLPRNMLQHSPISFRRTNFTVLDFLRALHHISSWKVLIKTKIFSASNPLNFLSNLSFVNMELQQLKLCYYPFKWLIFGENMRKSSGALRRICPKWAFEVLPFF